MTKKKGSRSRHPSQGKHQSGKQNRSKTASRKGELQEGQAVPQSRQVHNTENKHDPAPLGAASGRGGSVPPPSRRPLTVLPNSPLSLTGPVSPTVVHRQESRLSPLSVHPVPPAIYAGPTLLSVSRTGWFRKLLGRGGESTVTPALIKRGTFDGQYATLVMLNISLANRRVSFFGFDVCFEYIPSKQQTVVKGLLPGALLATEHQTGMAATSLGSFPARRSAFSDVEASSPTIRSAPDDLQPSHATEAGNTGASVPDFTIRPRTEFLTAEATIMRAHLRGESPARGFDSIQVMAFGPDDLEVPPSGKRKLWRGWKVGPAVKVHGTGVDGSYNRGEEDQLDQIKGARLFLQTRGEQKVVVRMEPATHLDAGCPRAYQVAFVVRHNVPVDVAVKPSGQRAHERLRHKEGQPRTLIDNSAQDTGATFTTCGMNNGKPCSPTCAEFNSTHMTREVWKRKLCFRDLREFNSPENEDAWVQYVKYDDSGR